MKKDKISLYFKINIVLMIAVIMSMMLFFFSGPINNVIYSYKVDMLMQDYDGDSGYINLYEDDITFMNTQYYVYDNEFSVCFGAEEYRDEVVFVPHRTFIFNSSKNHIYTSCTVDNTLLIHSHPNGNCGFSDTDLATFQESEFIYFGVICGENMYNIIDRNEEQVAVRRLD